MTKQSDHLVIPGSATDTGSPNFTSPSFAVATTSMSGGASTEGALLYGFSIPDNWGYAMNGNVLSSWDSVMGSWSYAYDNLNRLTSASATASGAQANFTNSAPSWSYDAFGNRTGESWGCSGNCSGNNSVPATTSANFTAGINQMSGAQYTYDAAGDVTYDGLNNYLYDAEGRICAVKNSYGAMTGYIYDAGGIRVARGSLQHLTCDFNSADTYNPSTNQGFNGFQTTTSWVLGPGGEQVTEYSVSGGASTWVHTNAYASGTLLATYTQPLPPNGSYAGAPTGDTIFALEDWLGTKRAEVSAGGCYSTFTSMPYGNGLTPSGNCPDATEHHFTSKERDPESGNDYFGARYYASTMGRWLSPDWSANQDPIPYGKLDNPQSLNLYSYLYDNPLNRVDVDGHGELWDKFKAMFFAKADVGVGLKLEGDLGKHFKAGFDAFAGVEKKFSSEGTETTLKAEAGGGIKVGPASGIVKGSIEKQIEKNGAPVDKPAEPHFEKPHIGGESGAASGEATSNELSLTVTVPDTGSAATGGGTVGIDLDKAADFGATLMQKTFDTVFHMVVPQNVPIDPPQLQKQQQQQGSQ